MTVTELMRNNFDAIFIELNPVNRESMMREAYTEDCVWIHPGGRLVGIAAINEAASEIRKRTPGGLLLLIVAWGCHCTYGRS